MKKETNLKSIGLIEAMSKKPSVYIFHITKTEYSHLNVCTTTYFAVYQPNLKLEETKLYEQEEHGRVPIELVKSLEERLSPNEIHGLPPEFPNRVITKYNNTTTEYLAREIDKREKYSLREILKVLR